MFTGIIEETGLIKSVSFKADSAEIVISASTVLDDIKTGDSICVDGICLTVTVYGKDWFTADAGAETMEITTLRYFTPGKKVNLERALKPNTRMGGHMVSGHVDGIARVRKISRETGSWKFCFSVPGNLNNQIIKKGSVAINGISLTIADITADEMIISVIPHTYLNTNLSALSGGDRVNIETDLIGKYVVNYLRDIISSPGGANYESRIDVNFLREHGFIG